MSFRNR